MDVMITLQPMNICMAAADLVWSRVFKEYPTLKVALSEGGTGWIPYFLDRLDRTFDMNSSWTGQDFGGKLPSDIIREHFMTCFITDPVGLAMYEEIGEENMCWEMDYPHSDSSWPGAPDEFAAQAAKYKVPDRVIDKITHENAMRLYQFDPFAIRPKERSTVAALRAEVAGHDVSERSFDTGRFEKSKANLAELQARATA
jgi:predicted TIM-barrel fold metal-dependent hydrolase